MGINMINIINISPVLGIFRSPIPGPHIWGGSSLGISPQELTLLLTFPLF